MKKKIFALAIIFTLVVALVRFAPHPADMIPAGALALWAGSYLNRRFAALAMLVVFVPCDAIAVRGLAVVHSSYIVSAVLIIAVTYACMALYVAIGRIATRIADAKKRNGARLAGVLVGSALFYLITNAASFPLSLDYPQTIAGFFQCMAAGIPYWMRDLVANWVGVGVFFGATALLLREKSAPVASPSARLDAVLQ